MKIKTSLIDLINAQLNPAIGYGGTSKKDSIIYNDKNYMIKFSKCNDDGRQFSEYIGCSIFKSCGIDTQNAFLAYYENNLVVACENFMKEKEHFMEFTVYIRKHFSGNEVDIISTYQQLNYLFENDNALSVIKNDAISRYWEQYIIDALINNSNRGSNNFGYIYNIANNELKCAPVYDCSRSLCFNYSEQEMIDLLSNPIDFIKIILIDSNSALKSGKNKINFYDMLSSNYDQNCSKALLKIYPKIDMEKIEKIIDEAPSEINEVRKTFYKVYLRGRKELILDNTYRLISKGKHDKESYDNIANDKHFKESQLDSIISDLSKNGWKYENLFTEKDIEVLKENGVEIKLDDKENDKDIILE